MESVDRVKRERNRDTGTKGEKRGEEEKEKRERHIYKWGGER